MHALCALLGSKTHQAMGFPQHPPLLTTKGSLPDFAEHPAIHPAEVLAITNTESGSKSVNDSVKVRQGASARVEVLGVTFGPQ